MCVFEDFGALQWSVVVGLLVRQKTGRTGHHHPSIAPAFPLTCFCQRLFGWSRLPTSPPAVLAILALAALPRSLHCNWLKLPLAASPRRRRPSRSQQRLLSHSSRLSALRRRILLPSFTSPHPIYLLRSSFPLSHFLLLHQVFLLLKESLIIG